MILRLPDPTDDVCARITTRRRRARWLRRGDGISAEGRGFRVLFLCLFTFLTLFSGSLHVHECRECQERRAELQANYSLNAGFPAAEAVDFANIKHVHFWHCPVCQLLSSFRFFTLTSLFLVVFGNVARRLSKNADSTLFSFCSRPYLGRAPPVAASL